MANILIYGSFNQRSRDTESVMIAFRKKGHKVFCLTQQEGFKINDFLAANGVSAYSHIIPGNRSGWWYYFRQFLFFVRFCRQHRIDVVYSHLEPANFVTAFGQYFIKAKAYLCRHHIDEGQLYQFDSSIDYWLTYRLARKIIVVSDHAKRYMIEKEHISGQKIIHINLAYDFDLYDKAEEGSVKEIRQKYKSDILLLSACRLTEYKRPEMSVHTVKKLSDLGFDVKLVLLGQGELLETLQVLIRELGLQNRVFMPGYVDNVLDFMSAADFFLHPSLLDSSCVAIKEAGLTSLPVIVCRGIGDFEDYIVDGKNGFSVDPDKFAEASSEIIIQNWAKKEFLESIGAELRTCIMDKFSIENVIGQYDPLNATS